MAYVKFVKYFEFMSQWQDWLPARLHGLLWTIPSLINEQGRQVPISPKSSTAGAAKTFVTEIHDINQRLKHAHETLTHACGLTVTLTTQTDMPTRTHTHTLIRTRRVMDSDHHDP